MTFSRSFDLSVSARALIYRENIADLATTLVYECTHAELYSVVGESYELAKREVEAERWRTSSGGTSDWTP